MSSNILAFGISDIWLPKPSSESSWPSSTSTSSWTSSLLSSEKKFRSPLSMNFTISPSSRYSTISPSSTSLISISVILPSTAPPPSISLCWPSSTIVASRPHSNSTKNLFFEENKENGNSNHSDDTRLKTKMCRNIKESGMCQYDQLCKFAHSLEEMKGEVNNNGNSKYKTSLCQKYWIHGFCVYGPNCNFIHYENVRNNFAKETLPVKTSVAPVRILQRSTDNHHQVTEDDAVSSKDLYDSGNSSQGSCGKSPTFLPLPRETSAVSYEKSPSFVPLPQETSAVSSRKSPTSLPLPEETSILSSRKSPTSLPLPQETSAVSSRKSSTFVPLPQETSAVSRRKSPTCYLPRLGDTPHAQSKLLTPVVGPWRLLVKQHTNR